MCSYTTARNGHLKRHVETIHKGLKPYACEICTYAAGQKGTLMKHIKSVHNK